MRCTDLIDSTELVSASDSNLNTLLTNRKVGLLVLLGVESNSEYGRQVISKAQTGY